MHDPWNLHDTIDALEADNRFLRRLLYASWLLWGATLLHAMGFYH